MRKFCSYGPVDTEEHYYVPRSELIEQACSYLRGDNPQKGGHYITVWAPRQTGKSWLLMQVLQKVEQAGHFDIVKIDLEHLRKVTDVYHAASSIVGDISRELGKKTPPIETLEDFQEYFTRNVFEKPLILILDEFDSLHEEVINSLASIFRNIYIRRKNELRKPVQDRRYMLHGLALVGVRSVLGIENDKGSPFNIQLSFHVPNLSAEEVNGMFQWYKKESGQHIDQDVIDRIFDETRGQPGLTCWIGELLTETHNLQKDNPITMDNFNDIYSAATQTLPNNNILNIIGKVKPSPYREWVLELFKTGEKISFNFDDESMNYLFMNGVIDLQKEGRSSYYVRFASPFVQKRLFNYFSNELFDYMGQLMEPFESLSDVISGSALNIRNLMKLYGRYLSKNREWLLKDAPRRKDLRYYEAVYHFNLYMYLFQFLKSRGGKVYPEFPTGNGKIDLVVHFKNLVYGIELKSFTHEADYKDALKQAARYGKKMKVNEIVLVFFVESITEERRQLYESSHLDKATNVTVEPIFITTAA